MPVTNAFVCSNALASYSVALSNLTSIIQKAYFHMHTKPQNHTIPPLKHIRMLDLTAPNIYFQFPRVRTDIKRNPFIRAYNILI